MNEHKDEIYLLIILFLVILTMLTPSIKAEIHSKEECRKKNVGWNLQRNSRRRSDAQNR